MEFLPEGVGKGELVACHPGLGPDIQLLVVPVVRQSLLGKLRYGAANAVLSGAADD
jgi:hypothetical protein